MLRDIYAQRVQISSRESVNTGEREMTSRFENVGEIQAPRNKFFAEVLYCCKIFTVHLTFCAVVEAERYDDVPFEQAVSVFSLLPGRVGRRRLSARGVAKPKSSRYHAT